MKYNPGFESDQQVISHFSVRFRELEVLLGLLADNARGENVNRHALIVGPRGSGKTTLVRRIAAEVREAQLPGNWYPLVFGEEAYEVTSPGEFWLEAVFHLAEQTDEPQIRQSYARLRAEMDEDLLREQSLNCIFDFCEQAGKRILLVVENLNMLLLEQMDPDSDHHIERVLCREPRLMLLGTTTTSFESEKKTAWSDPRLFLRLELNPLDLQDCLLLWNGLTGKNAGPRQVRPLQILTGGNPRLLTILSGFAVNRSFKELMANLIQLIDDHTDYFKSQLESLSPLERKVFVALLELWDPSGAREIAAQARLDVNRTSAMLKRLSDRNAVTVVDDNKRKKRYQAAERLYNIYYLMRRRGHPSSRVRAAVSFMVHYYQEDELLDITRHIAQEAIELDPEQRLDHLTAFGLLLERHPGLENEALLPPSFLSLPDLPQQLRERLTIESDGEFVWPDWVAQWLDQIREPKAREARTRLKQSPESWFELGRLAGMEQNDEMVRRCYERGVQFYSQVEVCGTEDVKWLAFWGLCLSGLGRLAEAEEVYSRALELAPTNLFTRRSMAHLLLGQERYEEARQLLEGSLAIQGNSSEILSSLGFVWFRLKDYELAIKHFQRAVEQTGDDPWIWNMLGFLNAEENNRVQARECYNRALSLIRDSVVLMNLGNTWLDESPETALTFYEEALKLAPADVGVLNNIGIAYARSGRPEKAKSIFEQALKTGKDNLSVRLNLADLLHQEDPGRATGLYVDCMRQPGPNHEEEREGIYSYIFKRWFELQRERGLEVEEIRAQLKLLMVDQGAGQLNTVAWDLFPEDEPEWLEDALALSRQAVALDPAWEHRHTLATILATLGRGEEALNLSADLLRDELPRGQDEMIDDFSRLFIELAASGFAQQAVLLLEESAMGAMVEPLVAGLHIFQGEQPRIAHEIFEVGRDIADSIHSRIRVRSKRENPELANKRSGLAPRDTLVAK